jgi:hypothetical protein
MSIFRSAFFTVILLCFSLSLWSQPTIGTVPLKVSEHGNGTGIKFQLNNIAPGDTVYFQRRVYQSGLPFQPYTNITGVNAFIDVGVVPGQLYEYKIIQRPSVLAESYVVSGINFPLVANRGSMLLLIKKEIADSLVQEIQQLQSDLTGDGWLVKQKIVHDTEDVPAIKSWIVAQYNADPEVKSLFILGHVPVPYSGHIYPDGHTNHMGAWPADGYYGDMDGVWTDLTNFGTPSAFPQNWNLSVDGKFDQSNYPSDIELEVGRVDLFTNVGLTYSEVDLTRRYLEKLHNYKFKLTEVVARGLVDNNFSQPENFAASGYRNFYSLLGYENVFNSDFVGQLADSSYQWAYGCGAGSITSCAGVATFSDFFAGTFNGVFTMLFGSLFGDWNLTNNLLVGAISSKGSILTSCWAGRPHWFFHPMGMGHTIGHCTKLTMNDSIEYTDSYGKRMVHIGLMGDPSLRQHVLEPVGPITVQPYPGFVSIAWQAPLDSVDGYCVYKKDLNSGKYLRISPNLVTNTYFYDMNPSTGLNYYMVRSVKKTSNSGGSYYNQGQGVFKASMYPGSPNQLEENIFADLKIAPNPSRGRFTVDGSGINDKTLCSLYDLTGREVPCHRTFAKGRIEMVYEGSAAGVYFIQISGVNGETVVRKVVLEH